MHRTLLVIVETSTSRDIQIPCKEGSWRLKEQSGMKFTKFTHFGTNWKYQSRVSDRGWWRSIHKIQMKDACEFPLWSSNNHDHKLNRNSDWVDVVSIPLNITHLVAQFWPGTASANSQGKLQTNVQVKVYSPREHWEIHAIP